MRRLVPLAESPMHPVLDRLAALSTVVLVAVLVTALLQVEPDARGRGTHEQFGMEPCGWPQSMGIPCPTCGVTTAASLLFHLRPIQAVFVQPFGAALSGFGLVLAGLAGFCLLRRKSYLEWLGRLPLGTLVVSGVVLLLLAWLYKYLTFVP